MSISLLGSIKLLLLDVDGVLTDGRIIYGDGEMEAKAFHAKDGLGIRMIQGAGVSVGVVTGRTSAALKRRCDELGIHLMYDGVKDKGVVLSPILAATGLSSHEVAFVGDDLPDIPLLKQVGAAIAVADAHELVKRHAHLVTRRKGGHGAVREVCEEILKASDLWEKTLRTWE